MIQRIQSIYLFLAAGALGGSLLLPLGTASGDATVLVTTGDNLFADGIYWAKEFPGWIMALFLSVCAIFAIFFYKNRPRQMKLALGILFGAILFLAWFAALGYSNAQHLPDGTTARVALGSILEPLAIPLLILAYRAINKDEKLVRSSDRLR